MSHFCVLVIGEDVEKQLQPYHEFECTGVEDEYVVSIDKTAEALEEYNSDTSTMLKGPDGVIHDRFDEDGNWKLEFSKVGEFGRREAFIPPGYEKVEVPTNTVKSAAKYISDYFGWPIAGQDDGDDHKYGHIELDKDGNVVKCIDRTNPNKKWDWWVIGGRWNGFLKLKEGRSGQSGEPSFMGGSNEGPGYADIALKGDIDIEGMRRDARLAAEEKYDAITSVIKGRSFKTWDQLRKEHNDNISLIREIYHGQQVVKDIQEIDRWNVDQYAVSREDFVKRAEDGAFCSYAIVMDSKWYAKGEMGWWGISDNKQSESEWASKFAQLMNDLPDDVKITVVDCHI